MIRKKRVNLPPGDDGRTIVSMNVEGMPGYSPTREAFPAGIRPPEDESMPSHEPDVLTRDESRVYLWGAVKAGLLIVLVMSAGMILFVLFCQYVWFR